MRKYIVFVVLLALLEIGISLFLSHWREAFWIYVEKKQFYGFISQICVFTGVALVYCLVSGASGYFQKLASIEWSKKIVAKGLNIVKDISHIENYSQRLENDSSKKPELFLTLAIGISKSIGYILAFSVFLVYNYAIWYIIPLYLYALVTHFITKIVAAPLIPLNYEQENANATFRLGLNIANFTNCIRVAVGLAKKTKRLTYIQSFVDQIGVILPLLLISYEYFTTNMNLGQLMMFNGSAAILVNNLLYPLNQFSTINSYLAANKRLKEIGL